MSDRESRLARWPTLTLEVPEDCEDSLVGRLSGAVVGVERRASTAGRCRLVLCLPDGADVDAVEAEALAALASAGVDRDRFEVRRDVVEDGRWVERYVEGLRPFALGRRFAILPGTDGLPGALAGRVGLRLVPGRAFGTGEHATTRLCAGALEDVVRPRSRWIDVGCGTGVLAIVARHCGAAEALALDTDAEAVAVARDVLRANGISSVRVVVGSLGTVRPGSWDGVVANVSANFARSEARAIATALRPGGRAIISGFLDEDVAEIEARARAAGLRPVGRRTDGEWRAIVAVA